MFIIVPAAIEPDIRAANLSILLTWIDMADKIKENFFKMKERAKQCDTGMCDIGMPMPDYEMEEDPNAVVLPPIPDMVEKIDDAIEKITIYENRLLEELRKPEKDWNYSVESSTTSN